VHKHLSPTYNSKNVLNTKDLALKNVKCIYFKSKKKKKKHAQSIIKNQKKN